MTADAAILTHWVAAGAYSVLAVLVLVVARGGRIPALLTVAAAVEALWAAALARGLDSGAGLALTLTLGESLRSAAWVGLVSYLLMVRWADTSRNPLRAPVWLLAATLAVLIGIALLSALQMQVSGTILFLRNILFVAVSIGGLVLTHNLYVASAPTDRWSLGVFCIALAGIFAYDVNLHTFTLLEPLLGRDFFEARGLANALVVPLFGLAALRNPALRFSLSRQAAVQTFALGAIGLYLVAMSVAAYLIGLFGGDWARLFQIALIFLAVIVAGVLLLSGRVRAWVRVKINKHFFAYKYDYREEWLRFIATVSNAGPGFGNLSQRVIAAIASIVDSPGGALFERDDDGSFVLSHRWNMGGLPAAAIPFSQEDLRKMRDSSRILDLTGEQQDRLPPQLREDGRLWLAVPLVHLDDVPAVVVVQKSRVARELDWEDFDILRTVGRQAGSLIAEERALADLEESRKFEEFNRRFAFIMHDIKNLVSQLSLLSRNAEKHAGNPEFQRDMAATLQGSVDKMKDLLVRLGTETGRERKAESFDLRALAERLCAEKSQLGAHVILDADAYPLQIDGDAAKIEQAVNHLIQNAIDASERGSPVHVRLRNEAGAVKLIVEDRGRGMSEAFIAEELFKPFRSTKEAGFGVGAFEARELIRNEGGRLDVTSEPGEGTRFVIHLPPEGRERKAARDE
ncbi:MULTISPECIES: XrtA/PEP-CTERM system histidine kinase PrsK [Pacificimonas]|uniref:histidine kinase n=1 Tax=Pacificimonas aurantium TaxID=1250540 RepID=A0ABS7WM22_9SPHN|nr:MULTISPECIES: XrtA/PEP-CTERM system histidine kinase PrsK [Pacificimonas]MBZ6378678.1 PEP-CTERM system histidine kinase PrsK [Pacificimonas aurantium]